MNAIFLQVCLSLFYTSQGVSLKIYTGEITAILGHNGAGKFWMENDHNFFLIMEQVRSNKSFVPVKMIISLCVASIDCGCITI